MSRHEIPARTGWRAVHALQLLSLALLAGCEGQLLDGEPGENSADSPHESAAPERAPALASGGGASGTSAPHSDSPLPPAAEEEVPPASDPDLSVIEGNLEVYVTHFEDTSTTSYDLIGADGVRRALSLAGEPTLATGDELRVRGKLLDDGKFEVAAYSLLNDDEERFPLRALTSNGVRQTGRVAALMVHFGTPDSLTKEQLRTNLFSTGVSAAELHKEASYNLNQINGDVFGWLQVPPMVNCDTRTLATNAIAAARSAGIDIDSYTQIAYYFPRSSQCSWSGLAYVGRPKSPARDSWYNGSSGCGVLAHELGHNIGAQHARSYDCGSSALGATGTCTYSEYGDPFDVMGSGSCTHFNGYVKAAEGWYGGCNAVTVTSDASFDIVPIELPSNAIQTLRVPMDASLCPTGLTSCYYYLEYRQPVGKFDSRLPNSLMHKGVLVRVGSSVDFSGAGRPQAPYLLDMTPGSRSSDFQDAALVAGASFVDAKGVRISVTSLSTTAAKVAVSFPGGGSGAATCIDGTSPGQVTPPPTEPPPPPPTEPPPTEPPPPPPTEPPPPPPSTGCGTGEAAFGGHCYLKIGPASYDGALNTCKARGAGWSLAEVESAQENQFVASVVGTQESWLGATDRAREGSWLWQSGVRFYAPLFLWFSGPVDGRYTSFVSGEPNDGGGNSDCMRMVSGGGWRDGNCADNVPAICERQ